MNNRALEADFTVCLSVCMLKNKRGMSKRADPVRQLLKAYGCTVMFSGLFLEGRQLQGLAVCFLGGVMFESYSPGCILHSPAIKSHIV